MANDEKEGSEFLDRFDEEPREGGRVVRRAFPDIQEERDDSPHGRVEDGQPPWRERRWARWLVVGVIWLVALMLVGSVLIQAF